MTETVTPAVTDTPPAFIFPNGSIHYADVEPDLTLEHMIAEQRCNSLRRFDLHEVRHVEKPKHVCRACRRWLRDERDRRKQLKWSWAAQ